MKATYHSALHTSHGGRIGSISHAACVLALLVAIAASPSITAAGPKDPSATPNYPRYRLIDLGTFGGPNSGGFGPNSTQLNNRGEVIAQLGTTIPDPYCLNFDCFAWNGAVRETNGILIDLGGLTKNSGSVPVWISESGLIAGNSANGLIDPLTDFPQFRAVLWNQDRSIRDLGTLGGNASQGLGVNSRGQVVGMALNAIDENPDWASLIAEAPSATQARAFLWQEGSMHDLGTLGGNDATAWEVNERGQIVGLSYTDTEINETTGYLCGCPGLPTLHPFLWENGVMHDLGSLGGTFAIPSSIGQFGGTHSLNDSGEVAGTSTLPGDEVWHAFLWSKGKMIDLGTLGGSKSDATALNNKGQVIGRAVVTDVPFVRHAFLWEKGQMTDLGTVAACTRSTAQSINSAGQIIGGLGSCTDNSDDLTFSSAFYVEKGKPMVDLNTLIVPPSQIHLEDAWNINERGEIFAHGLLPDGSERVILLLPRPGP